MSNLLPRDYLVLDFETNGLDPTECDVIEVGLLTVLDGVIVEKMSELANPGSPLSKKIVEITNITDDMLVGKRKPLEVMLPVIDYINNIGGMVLGQNIVKFDRLFLEKYCAMSGRKKPEYGKYVDTASLFKEFRLKHTKGSSNFDVPKVMSAHAAWTESMLEYTFPRDKVLFNLNAAVNYLAIPQFNIEGERHRALYDCILTHKVFEVLRGEMKL